MVFIVGGQLNLHHSDIVGGDFLRYLHGVNSNYRLAEQGFVQGMDSYKALSKQVRTAHVQRVLSNTQPKRAQKKDPINFHSTQFKGDKIINQAKETIPDRLETNISELWNLDFTESLIPFAEIDIIDQPPVMEDKLELDGKTYKLHELSKSDRLKVVNEWQKNAIAHSSMEKPAGFIFGLQEPYYKNNKMGCIEKSGHSALR